MKFHRLLFHDILIDLSFFFFNLFFTNRYDEVLRSVYSKETVHAIGGGLGVLVDVATEERLVCNY